MNSFLSLLVRVIFVPLILFPSLDGAATFSKLFGHQRAARVFESRWLWLKRQQTNIGRSCRSTSTLTAMLINNETSVKNNKQLNWPESRNRAISRSRQLSEINQSPFHKSSVLHKENKNSLKLIKIVIPECTYLNKKF